MVRLALGELDTPGTRGLRHMVREHGSHWWPLLIRGNLRCHNLGSISVDQSIIHADVCRVNDLSYFRPDGMLVAAIEVNECKLWHDIENGI